jgi:hypothetical protein
VGAALSGTALPDSTRVAVRAKPAPRPASGPGSIIVQTVGGWARISIDGVFVREGISDRETAEPGRHRIHLDREGYEPVDTAVTVRAGDTIVVRLTIRKASP